MSKTYTITLSDAQEKALASVAYSPQEWMENFIFERCRLAIDDIANKEIQRKLDVGETITGTKEDLVLAADVESAKEYTDRIVAERNAQ